MPDISKLTKAQLVNIIQKQEEDKYAVLKEETGLPFNTDEEWVNFIKKQREDCLGWQNVVRSMSLV